MSEHFIECCIAGLLYMCTLPGEPVYATIPVWESTQHNDSSRVIAWGNPDSCPYGDRCPNEKAYKQVTCGESQP